MKKGNTNHKFAQRKKNYLILSNDGFARGLMSFAYFKKRLNELKLSDRVNVQVSGLITSKGLRPELMALKTLRKKGLSINGFGVRSLSEELLGKTDVVIALSQENHNYLKNSYRTTPLKIRILEVPVILGNTEDAYEKTFAKIKDGLEQELQSLQQKS